MWCLKKARNFLLGAESFKILTDHKPLIGTFRSDRSLESIENLRLRKMKEKPLGYRFTIEHIDGKKNIVTDTLSRYPVSTPDSDDKELANELYICSSYTVSACVEDMGVDIQKLKDIAASDLEYQTLLHKVVNDDFAV